MDSNGLNAISEIGQLILFENALMQCLLITHFVCQSIRETVFN